MDEREHAALIGRALARLQEAGIPVRHGSWKSLWHYEDGSESGDYTLFDEFFVPPQHAEGAVFLLAEVMPKDPDHPTEREDRELKAINAWVERSMEEEARKKQESDIPAGPGSPHAQQRRRGAVKPSWRFWRFGA
jgi:hypothetical protein